MVLLQSFFLIVPDPPLVYSESGVKSSPLGVDSSSMSVSSLWLLPNWGGAGKLSDSSTIPRAELSDSIGGLSRSKGRERVSESNCNATAAGGSDELFDTGADSLSVDETFLRTLTGGRAPVTLNL
jgi:hypothetical protein